ncbi:hypothetical protein [Aurantiacibacter poecillastricola]|uniref:hypothetical protein n=1 Tax=Aurantiacibacter poecillastricola TaxID=3064385 RepID=UPI00273E4B8C|nr:hypothetical protein [Aurantiacibacter sp. 219JJ12-13]MDP5262781.1 hypothetical protein [Aurantiacibacter sp. 219JJ12-13]
MTTKDDKTPAGEGPGPKFDPATKPLKASELAADEGGQDSDAWHGARDRKGVNKDRTKPDEIDIERGDIDKPGDTPDEIPTGVPDEEILPPD